MMISTSANYHWVKTVSASTHGNGVLKLTFRGDRDSNCQFNESEINVFTDNEELTARLIAAINSASVPAEVKEPEDA